MKILQYPSEVLSTPSLDFNAEDVESIKSAKEALRLAYAELPSNKLGLAAPQIGIQRNMAICLGLLMMNLSFKPARQVDGKEERCYSIEEAKIAMMVWRPSYGYATWTDPDTLEVVTQKVGGIKARVFQHELDHINGLSCRNSVE